MTTFSQTYDPSAIAVTFGAIRITGFATGSFVAADRDEDSYAKVIGSTGDPVRTRNANRGGSIKIVLHHTSPTNDLLFAQARIDEFSGGGSNTIQIQDLGGTMVVHATNAWVKKIPTTEYGSDLGSRAWVFDCDRLDFVSGSGVSTGAETDQHAYVQLDGFEIDGVMTEDHTYEAEITEHPVESGTDVADNVRSKPTVINLNDCVVSDTPIGDIAGRRPVGSRPSSDARTKLEQIRDNREPITILTALRTYENMVLQNLSITKSSKELGALRFKATFKQITFVTNLRTTVRVSVPSASKKLDLGKKPQKPTSETATKEDNRSILAQGSDWLSGKISGQQIGDGKGIDEVQEGN